MSGSGWGGLIGSVAVCAAAWVLPSLAAADPRDATRAAASGRSGAIPAPPAVQAGDRSASAEELARAGRAMGGTPSTTIWRSRLADGTLELSDRPPSGSASSIERRSYAQAAAPSEARQQADAEREYWRRQAEAFEQRRAERERNAARAQRERAAEPTVVVIDGRHRVVGGTPDWAWTVVDPSLPGLPPSAIGPSTYSSSPGAVKGRSAGGFIGSGFSSAR